MYRPTPRASTALVLVVALFAAFLAALLLSSARAQASADSYSAASSLAASLASTTSASESALCPGPDGHCVQQPGLRFARHYARQDARQAHFSSLTVREMDLEDLPVPARMMDLAQESGSVEVSVASHGADGLAHLAVRVGDGYCWGIRLDRPAAIQRMACGPRSAFEASDGAALGAGARFDASQLLPQG